MENIFWGYLCSQAYPNMFEKLVSWPGRGKIQLVLSALDMLNFLKSISVFFIKRSGKSVIDLLSTDVRRSVMAMDRYSFEGRRL